jgi:hypothetical protein
MSPPKTFAVSTCAASRHAIQSQRLFQSVGTLIREHAQVGFDPTFDAVLLNLDDDAFAAMQTGVVHLRRRG